MNYRTMMRDCVRYIENYLDEELDSDKLGQVFFYTGKYLSYLFCVFYNQPLDIYLEQRIKE